MSCPSSSSLSLFFFLNLDSTNERKHAISVFLSLAYFTSHNDLQFHNFILLCG
jgi:hypothetical protein